MAKPGPENIQKQNGDPQSIARAAIRYLKRTDPKLGRIIDEIGPHCVIISPNPFITLAGSIVQQQISMSAAAAVRKRINALCPRRRLTPRAILALSDHQLRAAGLSQQKTRYIRSLAEHFDSRRLTARMLKNMTDEQVIAATTCIVGVGKWTAEMLLIFCLNRPDVWPIDDLGLRKAVRNYLCYNELPDSKTMTAIGRSWSPYRTYAAWYLWRSLEGPLMPGVTL